MSAPAAIPHSRPTLERADFDALSDCLTSGSIAQGRLVRAFEVEVAARLGRAHGVATSSGTAALVLALRGLGLGAGQEVVLPSYVCHAVYEAVLTVGATPVLCDVEGDFTMTPRTVERVATSALAAVVVVHTFGVPVDTSAFRSLGVPLIDDVCQAFGAAISPGAAVTCASFHATKLLTTGEGGMALTDDPALHDRMRLLLDGDASAPHVRVPSPMTDLQAALGRSQLGRYDSFLRRRREIADAYFTELRGLAVELPERVRERSIFFRFPLRAPGSFEELRARYAERGIHVRQGVDAALHQALGLAPAAFAATEKTLSETLCLPILPSMTDDDVARIVRATREIFHAR